MIVPDSYHEPVMLSEILTAFSAAEGKKYIDATLGGGGHTRELLKTGACVLGIDQDNDAIAHVQKSLTTGTNFFIAKGNFSRIEEFAKQYGFTDADGILFDLGMSTHQITGSERGFSYMRAEPLDMRMDETADVTAADIINRFDREKLYEVFARYAEEIHSRSIATAIVRARTLKRIERTDELTEVISGELKKIYKGMPDDVFEKKKVQTIARIFQALRIIVNDEMIHLQKALQDSLTLLRPGGRIAVISYHSLEDRPVKLFFKQKQRERKIILLTKHLVEASDEEVRKNRKSRSAKLRIAEKL
jgi:16S rRNA (cytosine1402-N4)-methyltransferase